MLFYIYIYLYTKKRTEWKCIRYYTNWKTFREICSLFVL